MSGAMSLGHRYAVLVMGPTGVGKSDVAIRLAERLPLEIVSVDSALVYRGMDIGTAKPDLAQRARIAHHLIDIRDAAESYSAGERIHARRVPLDARNFGAGSPAAAGRGHDVVLSRLERGAGTTAGGGFGAARRH
jgi:tRNA dimethylallyltransferase